MEKILLIILTTAMFGHVNNVYAQSPLTDVDGIVSAESCFANERNTYDGFITYSVQHLKKTRGRKAKNMTNKLLEKRLTNKRFMQLKSNYDCQIFSYNVDNLTVDAFYLASKSAGENVNSALKPLAIFNRGGNKDYGSLSVLSVLGNHPIVDAGYVMLASQYRTNDEFGGKDLNDVMQLVTIGQKLPHVNPSNIHMIGVSRGGMMTYMAARKLKTLKSITVWAGPTNLEGFLSYRPSMERVYQARIPQYETQKSAQLAERSVMKWSHELPSKLPILILHGDADKAVNVIHATTIAKQLEENKQPHKLVIYKGDNHGLRKNRQQAYQEIIQWMNANNSH